MYINIVKAVISPPRRAPGYSPFFSLSHSLFISLVIKAISNQTDDQRVKDQEKHKFKDKSDTKKILAINIARGHTNTHTIFIREKRNTEIDYASKCKLKFVFIFFLGQTTQ